jgi:transposase
MKKFTVIAGIDVSKLKLDVSIVTDLSEKKPHHFVIENNREGILKMFRGLEDRHWKLRDVLFCFEHTGIYTHHLCTVLKEYECGYCMIPAIEINRSKGLVRGKTDKADSREIARYALTDEHKLKLSTLPEADIAKLKLLLVEKDKLKKSIIILNSTNENTGFFIREELEDILEVSHETVNCLKVSLKKIDKLIITLIKKNAAIQSNFNLACSVPGVGKEIAMQLVMYTRNFTCFDNSRKLACYAGMAPFEYSSGTSVSGRTKVSNIANKKLKSMLTMGSLAAMRFDMQTKLYYERKVKEGKNKMIVINAIRCKVIARVFAVVKRGTPFVDINKFAA